MRRPRLQMPRNLAVATLTLASVSCSPERAPDVVDTLVSDLTDRGTADDATDLLADAPADRGIDVPCDIFPGGPGWECIADFRSDANASCPRDRTCDPATCPTGCVPCRGQAYLPAGFACVPDPHADAAVACPSDRVCDPADCPQGCVSCIETFFCTPVPRPDGGTVASCDPQFVCNGLDCPVGCQPLG